MALARADLLHIIFYNETTKQMVSIEKACPRSALSYTAQLDPVHAGDMIHTWFFFTSENGKLRSGTNYLGPVILQA